MRKECIICKKQFRHNGPDTEFIKPMNAERVCKKPNCIQFQNSIDEGASIVPPWHPDFFDKTKDPIFRGLVTTNLESIEDEEKRLREEDRLKKRTKALTKSGALDWSIAADCCIIDYDGAIIAKFVSPKERAFHIQKVKLHRSLLESEFKGLLKKY